MILASGARGRGFDSPLAPLFVADCNYMIVIKEGTSGFEPLTTGSAILCSATELRTHITSDLASVAQMVERRTFNPVVAGSSPAEGAFLHA